jgi:hypothetical protein
MHALSSSYAARFKRLHETRIDHMAESDSEDEEEEVGEPR